MDFLEDKVIGLGMFGKEVCRASTSEYYMVAGLNLRIE